MSSLHSFYVPMPGPHPEPTLPFDWDVVRPNDVADRNLPDPVAFSVQKMTPTERDRYGSGVRVATRNFEYARRAYDACVEVFGAERVYFPNHNGSVLYVTGDDEERIRRQLNLIQKNDERND